LALNGLRADAVKWEAASDQALSSQQSANLFTAKAANDAKKEGNSAFPVLLCELCVRCGEALAEC
jgi:hypothetical protein